MQHAAARQQVVEDVLLGRRNGRHVLAQPALEPREAALVGRRERGVAAQCGQLLEEFALHFAREAGEQVIAVVDERLERAQVDLARTGGGRDDARYRRHPQHLGQTEHLEAADVGPADIELEPLVGQLGRGGIGVVVVVQFLAADEQAQRRDVGAGVGTVVVAVAPEVADAVDHSGREERYPDHLDRPDSEAGDAEEDEIRHEHHTAALPDEAGVEIALDPVIGHATTVALQGFGIATLLHVQLGAGPQHRSQAARLRAVRVLGGFAFGMVLAVHGHPIARLHARGEPQPEPEKVAHGRMQVEGAVRLGAMQEDRHGRDGHVGEQKSDQHELPGPQGKQAIAQEIQYAIH